MIITEYNPALAGMLAVPAGDKPQLLELTDKISRLCRQAREDGLLALEDTLPGLSEPLLKTGVRLVLDGTDADTVKGIMLTAIHTGGFQGTELVKRMMIADGVMLLQQGLNPSDVKTYLSAWLGEEEAAAAL